MSGTQDRWNLVIKPCGEDFRDSIIESPFGLVKTVGSPDPRAEVATARLKR